MFLFPLQPILRMPNVFPFFAFFLFFLAVSGVRLEINRAKEGKRVGGKGKKKKRRPFIRLLRPFTCPGVQAWDSGTKRTNKRVLLAESLSPLQNLELKLSSKWTFGNTTTCFRITLCLGFAYSSIYHLPLRLNFL